MIRHCWAILLACLALAACSPRDDGSRPSPAVWAVSRDGRTAGWLFGTIHDLPGDRPWRSAAVSSAVANAGILVVEAADLDRPALKSALEALATPVDGPPLAARLPVPLRAKLAELESSARIQTGSLDHQETWAAALALASLAGTSTGVSVDRSLLADFADRPVHALEGARRQLAIFDALPEADQRDLLAAVVVDAAKDPARQRRLGEAWRTGRLEALMPLLETGILADPELRQKLLVDRNRDWADQIETVVETGRRPLVAVGTAHMLGPHGLPALLAARGYMVRRLP